MKRKTLTYILICSILSVQSFNASAQGKNLTNPINIGTLIVGASYSDTKSNNPSNGYGNDYGQPSDDIYYKFTIASNSLVKINHCGTTFDTYIYLLNSSGTLLSSNNDNGPLCSGQAASVQKELPAGDYYIVSEGNASNYGNIITSISATKASVDSVNTDFALQMQQVFAHLEVSKVPFGLLKDIALEQVDLQNYNGILLTDSNYVDGSVFGSIYNTLVSAKISTNAPSFTDLSIIYDQGMSLSQPGKIVLNGLFYGYSKFKDDALQSGKVQVINNQVYDNYISGQWQNPYDTQKVFAISTVSEGFEGKTQLFTIPSALWFTNLSSTITNLQFDAGDGLGYRTVTIGQNVSVTYPSIGIKEIKFKLNLTDGTALYSRSKIEIQTSVIESYPSGVTIPINVTEAGKMYNGYMTIIYATPALGLQKPLIVAEGFDPGSLLFPNKKYGITNILTFQEDIKGVSSKLKTDLIDVQKYDIVYIDWINGTDDIKNNAVVLKQAIREVNIRKSQSGSTNPNIVLGISMGGLVARYALKGMENNGENHQTKLYISFDSPHQGANVPLAYQYMANHAKSLYLRTPIATAMETILWLAGKPGLKQKMEIASTPAARQMLINYVDSKGAVDNSIHDAWQSELKSFGYPSGVSGIPFKMIAVSNGPECATPQASTPGSSLVYYSGKANSTFLSDLISMAVPPLFPAVGFLTGQPSLVLGILPGRSEIKADMQLNASADGGGNQVYYNKVTYTKKLLWLIPITTTLTKDVRIAPSGILSYESYAGGLYSVPLNMTDDYKHQLLYRYSSVASNQPYFGFIPAPSALDIGRGLVSLTDADYKVKYIGATPPVSPKNSPFSSFITASNANVVNESHTLITKRNGDWLADEINSTSVTASNCTFACANLSMSGPAEFCTTATYSITNLPSGVNVNWYASGSIDLNGSSTNPTSLLKAIGTGAGTLTAVITKNGCDQIVTLNRNINVPALNPTFTVSTLEAGQECGIYVSNPRPDWTYNWSLSGPVQLFSGTNQAGVDFYTLDEGNLYVTVTITDGCGVSTTVNNTYYINGFNLAMYPNPANDQITISLMDEAVSSKISTTQISKPVEVELFDETGKVWNVTKVEKTSKAQMQTKGVPNGTYYLRVKNRKKVQRVLILH